MKPTNNLNKIKTTELTIKQAKTILKESNLRIEMDRQAFKRIDDQKVYCPHFRWFLLNNKKQIVSAGLLDAPNHRSNALVEIVKQLSKGMDIESRIL
jgi:hypothetical protein